VWRSHPLVAHWLDGIAIGEPKMMAGIEDRIRHYCTADGPVVTGLAAVGDAWACTNPSVGRGASIGIIHAVALRDQLRETSIEDRTAFPTSWFERTEATVRPWYDDTLLSDRDRLAQINAEIAGAAHVSTNELAAAFAGAPNPMLDNPDLLRGYLDIFMLFRTKAEVFADPKLLEAALAAKSDEAAPGPSRTELLEILSGS
jgi:flavin-dependent dehydrogenase